MLHSPRAVVDFAHAETAVAVAGADNPDAAVLRFTEHVVHQQISHLPIVTDAPHHPGDVGFDESGIGIAGVHHHDLGFERHPDRDMAVGTVDGTQNGPIPILVSHVDDLAAGGSPKTVVVASIHLKRDVAPEVSTASVPLLHCEFGTLEHLDAESLFMTLAARSHGNGRHDRADKPDLHRLQIHTRFGNRAPGTGVLHLFEEVLLVA